MRAVLLLLGLMLLAACSGPRSLSNSAQSAYMANEHWFVHMPQNQSSHSLAAASAQQLIESQLRSKGIKRITLQAAVAEEAVQHGKHRYAIDATVLRWHYDADTGRRPRVSLALEIRDINSGEIAWQQEASLSGRGQASLTSVASRLLAQMLDQVSLRPANEVASRSLAYIAGNSQPDSGQGAPMALSGALRSAYPSAELHKAVDTTALRGRSTAVFYAANPPLNVLSQFDRLVLEPDNIRVAELAEFARRGVETFAYLSIFEVGPERSYKHSIDPAWVASHNSNWNSQVMDLSHSAWQQFLIDRVDELIARGYSGLFLDTMDSYRIWAHTEAQRAQQEDALYELLSRIKRKHPDLALISNRGFEVLDRIAPLLEAVAAESLFASWDNVAQRYTTVSETDRRWLLSKLTAAKQQHGLDVIVIDYLPLALRAEARTVALKIAELGFIPWISTPGFDSVGLGLLEVMPREILMLYDSAVSGSLHLSEVYTLAAVPLEYLGYVPVYHDLRQQPLPQHALKGRYAGIVSWLGEDQQATAEARSERLDQLSAWFAKQLDDGLAVAFMGQLPFGPDSALAEKTGMRFAAALDRKSTAVQQRDKLIGFETALLPRLGSLPAYPYSTTADNTAHLRYSDAAQRITDLVVTGKWGGYALHPALVDTRLRESTYWIVDPFVFFRKALQLPDMPQPDVTTENGRRLWFAHIDGDALPSVAEMPGNRLGAEVIEERIFDRYLLPHTVSVVEGEMTGVGAYAQRRERMFAVARRIFARDEIEIASHSYSHPFLWNKMSAAAKTGKYNLPIAGYGYSAQREVAGSIEFINRELAPAGKEARVMLWSGDALPTEQALAVAQAGGLLNMNGGLTTINRSEPTLRLVSPMARTVGRQLQVNAPIMNENVYTNDWQGPYDGFRRVIETLELTDTPRRLKPANVYYHFYSGTKLASMRALEEVYDWSLAQDILPVVASHYISKVSDFRKAGVARRLDGSWKISSLGELRSLRLLTADRWPDLDSDNGIIGARRLHDGVYIHTDGAQSVSFSLRGAPPAGFHLVSSNALVSYWRDNGNALQFRLKGSMPVELEISGIPSGSGATLCQLRLADRQIKGEPGQYGTRIFNFPTSDTGDAILDCGT